MSLSNLFDCWTGSFYYKLLVKQFNKSIYVFGSC